MTFAFKKKIDCQYCLSSLNAAALIFDEPKSIIYIKTFIIHYLVTK